MDSSSRLNVLSAMIDTGLVPIFYHQDLKTSIQVVKACLDGGARCVEFTNRGPHAHQVFEGIASHFSDDDRLILGAGSIVDAATAALYLQVGADFIVGPVLNSKVAKSCNRRQVTYVPGCGSASEISAAQELGVEICKVFPASTLGGPDFIRSILGPMPWSQLMPTGGVSPAPEEIKQWIDAGAACLGIGSALISRNAVEVGNFDPIQQGVEAALAHIRQARQRPAASP
ncbi:MAG: bifunctional 4-hydroxy-2-oxoglutarate aldolase/2-dehydro-3-deoxy-phosphogluconate aldolase [Anaerolineales bacterium]